MATLVAAQALSGVQPRQIHAGTQSVFAVYSLTATLSAGDIIQMCKLPDRARVTDVQIVSSVNPEAGTCEFNVGIVGDTDKFIKSATLSANVRFAINNADGFGWVNDVSDDASVRSTTVQVEVAVMAGTGTKSGSISLIVEYYLD